MNTDDFTDAGRDADIGANTGEGRDANIGGSASRRNADDLQITGGGQTVQTGESPFSEEEAENADIPREGTPDDLKFGKRRTVGLDEDDGGGMADTSGAPGSTTGGS